MNEWLPLAVSIVGTAVAGYGGVKVAMARVEERLASLSDRVLKIEQEIGTHGTGIRGQLHAQNATLSKLEHRVGTIEDRLRKG